MNRNYGKHSEVKSNRGKLHDYLGTTFDFTEKAKVGINMDHYVKSVINEFTMKISNTNTVLTPPGNNIFEKGTAKFGQKRN